MALPSAKALFLAGVSGALFAVPLSAFAQAAPDPFSLSVNPTYPAPYSQALITPVSSLLDLASETFAVSVNGTELYRGNAQPVAVALGAAGSVASVRATLTGGGASYTQTLSLVPEDVALVAEPAASAPPLYAGKPLVPLSGTTRVVAVADLRSRSGTQIPPGTLSYSWTVDGSVISSSSGIGKESIIVPTPLQYRESDVSVVVTSPDGTLVGGASVALASQAPTLRLYENDPLLGILFDRALAGSQTIAGTEESLYASAFSFPLENGGPALEWFLNGTPAAAGPLVTLRPTGQGAGSAALSLSASSGGSVISSASLSLSFSAGKSGNLFGL